MLLHVKEIYKLHISYFFIVTLERYKEYQIVFRAE